MEPTIEPSMFGSMRENRVDIVKEYGFKSVDSGTGCEEKVQEQEHF